MVWMNSQEDTLNVLFIDGYVPSFYDIKSNFIKLANEFKVTKTKFADHVHYYVYRNKTFSNRERLNFFKGMVWKLNEKFCPHKYTNPGQDNSLSINNFMTPCYHCTICIEQKFEKYYNSIPVTSSNKDIESNLNVVRDELTYEKETKPHSLYLQNIIYYRIDNKFCCNSAEECCKNWINKLNFKVKKQNEYKNYSLFKNAWEKLLYYQLQCQFVKPHDDFLFFQYKRYVSEGYT